MHFYAKGRDTKQGYYACKRPQTRPKIEIYYDQKTPKNLWNKAKISQACMFPFKPKTRIKERQRGEGCPSPMQDLKPSSSPLKIHWISVVKRAIHQRSTRLKEKAPKEAKRGLRGGVRPPMPKRPQWDVLSMKIQSFFQLYTKSKIERKIGQKPMQDWGN